MQLPIRRRLTLPTAGRAARRIGAPAHAQPFAHQALLDLQRSIGNAAVTMLLARDTDKKTPTLKPRFAFVTGQLKPKEWAAESAREQFSDVAQLADATKLASVVGTSTSSINEISEVKVGGPAKPGLNLAKKYEHDATAGFVEDGSTWRGDILPATSSGAAPQVALVLGPKAFSHDEAYALGTVRHEMEHARHMELSVEWLLKWREAGAKKEFSSWIAEQASNGKIAPEILPLIRVEHESARGDTELLAYIEGFVTTLQYLPERPDLSLMLTGRYPHAISQLQELGKPENGGWAEKVRAQGLDRIHELCCKGLDEGGRQKLVAWVEALLDPSRFGSPSTKDEERAIQMIHNDFGTGSVTEGKESRAQLKRLLEDMLKVAKKPCK